MDNITDRRPDFRQSRRINAPRAVDLSNIDRLPPSSEPAEQGILGCCLLSPNDAIDICIEKFRGNPVFYDLRHQQIYDLLLKLHGDRKPVELMSVRQHFSDARQLEQVGGLTYLASLQDAVPSTANLSYYADIVMEKFMLRRLIQVCSSAVALVYEHEGEAKDILDRVERDILSVRDQVETKVGDRETENIIQDLMTKYDLAANGVPQRGMSTGLRELDKRTGGMGDQQLIYLAGSPSAGKTSLALNICLHILLKLGQGVGIFSLETSDVTVMHRMASAKCGVNGKLFLDGKADIVDRESMSAALLELQKVRNRLFICESANITMPQIMAKARRMKKKGARFFMIDYLQLISSPEKETVDRITQISIACKRMCKELNCPVLVISILSNEGMAEGKRPKMRHLKNSGQLQFDGDHIWLLHCEDPHAEVREVEIDIAKGKDSETGRISVQFYKTCYKFADMPITQD